MGRGKTRVRIAGHLRVPASIAAWEVMLLARRARDLLDELLAPVPVSDQREKADGSKKTK